MNKKLKVLVVDDATFMTKAISDLLESDPDIEVIGVANNGLEGLEKIKDKEKKKNEHGNEQKNKEKLKKENNTEKKEVFKEPYLGHHVDLMG